MPSYGYLNAHKPGPEAESAANEGDIIVIHMLVVSEADASGGDVQRAARESLDEIDDEEDDDGDESGADVA